MRYGLVSERGHDDDDPPSPRWLVWTIHHALYDGWSLPFVLDAIYRAYRGETIPSQVPFQAFVKHIPSLDNEAVSGYWRRTLEDCECRPFPMLPRALGRPQADQTATRRFPRPATAHLGAAAVTPSILIRAAWALVFGRMSGSPDVVFGAVVTGRSAPVAGIERMTGPTFATVPVRVRLPPVGDHQTTIADYLEETQRQAADMMAFEQTGLERIASLSPSLGEACDFQTLIVVDRQGGAAGRTGLAEGQPGPLGEWRSGNRDDHMFNTYALTLSLRLDDDEAGDILASASFDSRVLEPWVARDLLERLEHVIGQLSTLPASQPVSGIDMSTARDLDRIWTWNQTVPATAERFVADMIQKSIQSRPDASAVCAWDGELTYAQLGSMADGLASKLTKLGVGDDVLVPLCFEKSLWMTVALLGVIKAGGAFVLIDVSLPEARIQAIVKQVKAHVILSSAKHSRLASRLARQCVIVDGTLETGSVADSGAVRPVTDPHSLLYAVFTSGSTGVPKGVLITQANVASAVLHQTELMGLGPASRLFDFAAYSFDMAVSAVLQVLCAGGCLCVPSDQDRTGGLEQSMASLRANMISLTPSVAQLLSPSPNGLPAPLETLVLGGEALRPSDVQRAKMAGVKRLIHAYGPSECTPVSTINLCVGGGKGGEEPVALHMGKGAGVVTWIVDAGDHNILLPPGCVGELLLEGPLVGRGYLGDDGDDNDAAATQTAAAFIRDPPWLVRGLPGLLGSGRRGRQYKTGDLARYTEDGNLVFAGRKQAASQVKIRGQRVELGDIEHALVSHARVADAVAVVHNDAGDDDDDGHDEARIVAFVTVHDADDDSLTVADMTDELRTKLRLQLPSYMVPQAIYVLDSMPLNRNGKTDRKALLARLRGRKDVVQERLVRPPTTAAQSRMRDVWSRILKIDVLTIGLDDSFFQLGGSSIAAIKVVAEARRMGFTGLNAADMFRYPVLHELVEQTASQDRDDTQADKKDRGDQQQHHGYQPIAPFSLLPSNGPLLDSIIDEISARYGLKETSIIDIYPCTPLQEGLMSLTAQSPQQYIARNVLELAPDVSLPRLRAACKQVAGSMPTLRTRIVQHDDLGLVQVVLDEPVSWVSADSLGSYITTDKSRSMELGQPLTRFALVNDGGARYLIWTIHHALYDGWSMALMVEAIQGAYLGKPVREGPPFRSFIKYIQDQDGGQDRTRDYWRRSLDGCRAKLFPSLPPHVEQPTADKMVTHAFPQPENSRGLGVTTAALLRAAWALVVGRTTGTDGDVVFGVILSGRQAPLPGIESLAGPTFATVPLRVQWASNDERAVEFLRAVQRQAADMMDHEQVGLHRLANLHEGARHASAFQTLLVIQPPQDDSESTVTNVLGRWRSDLSQTSRPATYGLTLVVQLGEDDVHVEASFDSRMVQPALVDKLLRRLDHVVQQLGRADRDFRLAHVETLTRQDLEQIWQWNRTVPAASERCVHELFAETVRRQPDAPAVCAWDGDWTYRELDDASTELALGLVGLGIGSESVVTLCFGKSRWMPVAMLAIIKTGAAAVALDTDQPESRLGDIVQKAGSSLILCSAVNQEMARRLSVGHPVMVVSRDTLEELKTTQVETLPVISPSSRLYIAFTSGITWVPKAVVVTHANMSSLIHHVGGSNLFCLGPATRLYDSDAGWLNPLLALTSGSCLCIPSEADRTDDLAGSIRRMRATYAILTLSMARTLPPETMEGLQTLMLVGEALPPQLAARWTSLTRVLHAYGVCECTSLATVAALNGDCSIDAVNIGTGLGVNTWVVQTSNPSCLAPVGDTGELVLEGPLVGPGYLGDPERTAEAFIEDPQWLLHGSPSSSSSGGYLGRSGRLYRTGDLVRYEADGSLTFVGRKDTAQINIRGQKVELGEVKHHVHACFPAARQVTAEVIRPTDDKGRPSDVLAVFIVGEVGPASAHGAGTHSHPSGARIMSIPADVEDEIGRRLPRHMVPTAYLSLDELPVDGSSKIDRRRLRELGAGFGLEQLTNSQRTCQQDKRAPQTETEKTLQQVWARVLGIDASRIGADDGFLRLGGDSITAMQAAAAARGRGVHISTADILRKETISLLAETADGLPADTAGSRKEEEEEDEDDGQPFELSPIQRLYVATQPDPRACFDQSFHLGLREPISYSHLAESLETIVKRHDMLRARFSRTGEGEWHQRIVDDTSSSLHLSRVTDIAAETMGSEVRRCRERLNVETGPIVVGLLLDPEGITGRQSLFLTIHHLVIDLVSWRVLLEELECLLRRRPIPPPPALSFRKWCSLQAQYAAEHLGPSRHTTGAAAPARAILSEWGLDASASVQGATVRKQFMLDEASSTALMGSACNEAFGTRPVELLVSALIHSFALNFPDRPPPTVLNEGHGREPWDDDIDLSRTIGWFTTVSPASEPASESEPASTEPNLLDTIRCTKDFVGALPRNGWDFFTSRFADATNAAVHAAEYPAEIAFNYAGSFLGLGRAGSLFEMLESPSGRDSRPDSSSTLRRFALFEFGVHWEGGRLAVGLGHPGGMRPQHEIDIALWLARYEATLREMVVLLPARPLERTLTDFPLAPFASHHHLDVFRSVMVARLLEGGLINGEADIEDVYPCTGLQEGILIAQSKSPGDYRVQIDMEVVATQAEADHVSTQNIERAWRAVVRRHSLLRAVLVDSCPSTTRAMIVVLRDPAPSISFGDEDDDAGRPPSLGYGYDCRYSKDAPQHHLSVLRVDSRHVRLSLEINHAIIDGHSVGVLFRDFWEAYTTSTLSLSGPRFADFIRYVEARPWAADCEFWVRHLDGVQPCSFPSSSSSWSRVSARNSPSPSASPSSPVSQGKDLTITVPGLDPSVIHDFCSQWEVTSASVVQTAWALVLRCHTGSEAPCFGILASGRDAPVNGIQTMVGAVLGIMTHRVHLDKGRSVIDTIRQSRRDVVDSLPHQTYPLMQVHQTLGVGPSGLFNTIMSFQRLTDHTAPSADGHTMRRIGGRDPMEVTNP